MFGSDHAAYHESLVPCSLFADDGHEIKMKMMKTFEGKVLFECNDPELLFRHLKCDVSGYPLKPGTYTRGVFYPGEGTRFEWFDFFGSLDVPPVDVSSQRTEDLILSLLW